MALVRGHMKQIARNAYLGFYLGEPFLQARPGHARRSYAGGVWGMCIRAWAQGLRAHGQGYCYGLGWGLPYIGVATAATGTIARGRYRGSVMLGAVPERRQG